MFKDSRQKKCITGAVYNQEDIANYSKGVTSSLQDFRSSGLGLQVFRSFIVINVVFGCGVGWTVGGLSSTFARTQTSGCFQGCLERTGDIESHMTKHLRTHTQVHKRGLTTNTNTRIN